MADIPVRLFIIRNGEQVPFDGFTDEEKAKISKRLSVTMSDYFSSHMEEYRKLCESGVLKKAT